MRKGRGERGNEKGVLLSFFGQALNNTSERSEVSIKRTEQRAKSKETKLRVSERRGKIYFYYAERKQFRRSQSCE